LYRSKRLDEVFYSWGELREEGREGGGAEILFATVKRI
jgi:hypothetical protein